MKISLYYAPFSCALVPYMMLTEAGAEFDLRPINIRGHEHKQPEYLALNPKQKVPLLLVDGAPLSENVAIQQWIVHQFPEARLMPDDPWEAAQALSLCAWFASGVHPYISRYNGPKKFCDLQGSEKSVRELAAKGLKEQFRIADILLATKAFFFEARSVPDYYLFWCFRRARFFDIDLSEFTNIAAHTERVKRLPCAAKALQADDAVRDKYQLSA